ncbi:MAG: amidohydrolase [Verrucomicrobiia bacterium]
MPTSLLREAKELSETLIHWRRTLHEHPETAHEEQWTSQFIQDRLKEIGIPFQAPIGATGILASLGTHSTAASSIIALRADFDALPIEEKNDLSFRSKIPGKAHLCGHDAHTAILLGAATLLKKYESELTHPIRLIFQHAEEVIPGGAKDFLKAGAFERVKNAYALHNHPGLPAGILGINTGAVMAAAGKFEIEIIGKGGHGAFPQHCIDPIPITAEIISAAQTIISRKICPSDSVVISFGKIQAGQAYNVIPDKVFLNGTTRALTHEIHHQLRDQLENLIRGITQAHGATYHFKWEKGNPPLHNNAQAAEVVRKAAQALAYEENQIQTTAPMMGGEDFSFIADQVPSCYFFLGTRDESQHVDATWHSPEFRINEKVLANGSALFTQIALTH